MLPPMYARVRDGKDLLALAEEVPPRRKLVVCHGKLFLRELREGRILERLPADRGRNR